jgi:iron complex transport system substrate-binding protein
MKHWLAWLFVLAALACAAARAAELGDDRGRNLVFAQPPQRIVSLLPSLTESVCALGHCDRLVGVDRYSNYPAQVKTLPQLGGGIEPHIEAIVRLRPDVVLLASSSRAAARLESLGIRVLALEPKNQADVRRVLNALESALGKSPGVSAADVWSEIESGIQAASASLPARARQARVYFEVGRGPYAAGEASFIGEMLTRLGVTNIVPARLGPFPLLNPEFVARAEPDVMMFSSSSDMAAGAYPGWDRLKAMREKRICRFDDRQADMLVRPGPRLGEAARILAACLESATR